VAARRPSEARRLELAKFVVLATTWRRLHVRLARDFRQLAAPPHNTDTLQRPFRWIK